MEPKIQGILPKQLSNPTLCRDSTCCPENIFSRNYFSTRIRTMTSVSFTLTAGEASVSSISLRISATCF